VALDGGRRYALRIEARPAQGRGGIGVPPAFDLLWLPPAAPLLADAQAAAGRADVVVAFVGLNPALEGEEMSVNAPGFRGGDRTDLALPAPQEALLAAAFASGKPVIVVLTSGSAVAIGSAAARAAAVLAAWYGGEEIGTAVADTLAGVNNPAGRLPVTFYRSADQLPPFEDYAMRGRTYRYFTGDPLYAFGFGLSYSTFAYANLRMEPGAGGTLRVTARVTNTSSRDGDEVVQLYVGGGTGAGDPVRELMGVTRVRLRAGERRDVAFTLAAGTLPAGPATISVGGGQPMAGTAFVSGVTGAPVRPR
jgi:beta-glucosidase